MSIGSELASSDSIQARPGSALASADLPANTPASSGDVPRTPTPPLPSNAGQAQQQQQNQQHQTPQSIAIPTALQDVTPAPSPSPAAPVMAKPPAATAVATPPTRPPPPASAVSLHAAAAAAAANKQKALQATDSRPDPPSTSDGPAQTKSVSASNHQAGADSAPNKTAKTKANKISGTIKTKQKRKAKQAGAHDEFVYHPASSTAGGTIGAASDSSMPPLLKSAGGGRKPIPELVLPFQLPFVDVRPEMPMLDNASVQAAMAMGASETSSLDTGSDSDDYSVMSDDSDLDSEAEESRREARRRRREPATIEESLVLLQSLRQSRLSHLSSLLTPFSQRVRSGMIYPNVLPLRLLHGLNPRDPHILIQLGRADIHVGPHVFLKTKFWEVRPDYEMPPSMAPVGAIRAPGSYAGPSAYPRMTMPASLPQQLPQPLPPKLPSHRAAPLPAVPLPKLPAAQALSMSTPSTAARPAPAPASAAKPIIGPTQTTLPKPTLPAIPSQTSAAARPAVTAKPTVSPAATTATSAAASTAATPAVAATPTPASAKSASVSAASTQAAPSTSPPGSAAKLATPAAAPASGAAAAAGAASSASTDGKAAANSQTSTTVLPAPKPIAVPVSLPRPPMTTPSLPRPPSINQHNSTSAGASNPPTGMAAAPAALTKAPSPAVSSIAKPASTPASTAPSTPPATTPAPAAAPVATSAAPNAAGGVSTPAQTTTAGHATANATTPQAQARPAGVPPPPAIDAVLVSRVNATAALNPELQELLHIAASGKANPNQLKALGVWIQAITAQLRQDEARNAAATNNNAAGASGSRSANPASTTAEGKKTKKTKVDEAAKASKKQAKIEEREAKKKAKAEAKAKAQADKQTARKQPTDKQQKIQHQQQQHQQHHQLDRNFQPVSGKLRHPPPGWPTDGPPKPPVIIVEFRENPSMRFILPLWKCLVERTEGIERPSLPKVKKERRSFFDNDSDDEESRRIEPELKLSFFAPSLGSDAADGSGLRELEEELKRKAAEEAKLNEAIQTPTGSPSDGVAVGASSSTASPEVESSAPAAGDNAKADSQIKKKKGGSTTGSKKGSKATKPEVSDTMLLDYPQSKKHEVYPLTWSIKGGVTESLWEAFGRVPGTMTCQPVKREPEIELEPDVAEFLVPEIRYHLLDLPMEEIKIQKETTDAFVDLYSQVPDRRFILPRVAPIVLPQGLEDHLQDRFAVRPQCIEGRPMVKRKAGTREDDVSFSYEGIGLTVIGPNGVKTEPGAEPPKPPKRKRHVATHNPDGSIKSCGACGKTKTPMWRRGPKGPSQLCNACGARWKAGRLVVPDVAPPPIIEADEDKSQEEEARKEDEAQASMHGSNALVIPQSSGVDDDSFMAASGLVGPAPFADSFSLASEGKPGMEYGSSHLSRGSSSPSPFIRSPIPEDHVMPASVDPSMLSGSIRVSSHRR